MISVKQLSKVYGQTVAVDRVSFDVAKGEIVGFLGPNGAGKSTTMKILACFIPPTGGTATINGQDVFHQSEAVRTNLGYLPENVPLYTEMKVDEYLDFRGRLRGMDRAERKSRTDFVLDRCWLKDVRRRTIAHLSKGYRQRVGLADALLHNPPVLILDEPTVGLDPTQIREMRKLIKELAGEHTLLLSTHILPEVEAMCQRAVVIAGGRIVSSIAIGKPQAARVLVECRGPSHEVKMALERVSGVADVEMLDGKSDDKHYSTAAVRTKEGYDVREEVARTIQQKGWPLREVKLERASLEEFFIQVTAGQAMAR